MFTNSLRLCSRVKRQMIDDLARNISKTSTVTNSDVVNISLRQKQSDVLEDAQNKKLLNLKKYHRHLSTLTSKAVPMAVSSTVLSKEETREFMAIFPDLVRDLTDAGRHTDIPEITKWYSKVLQYNVPSGKKNRGLALVLAYKMFENPQKLTEENLQLAHILGWCVEMLQAFFLIMDDVMDGAQTRRGVPCWFRQENVGLSAINDAIMLENGIYSIIRKYFSNHPAYSAIIELFHDVTLKTSMGQALDCHSYLNNKPNLDLFTMDRYNTIVKYKTSYYTFQLPISLAMYLSGVFEPELHRQAKTVLLEMGHFFQVQDDFLDCYGNPDVTGKVGTDIAEGKCSWLTVVALQRASPEQKEIFRKYYGVNDPKAVEAIKDVYEELAIPHTYAVYEEENYNLILTHIQQLSAGLPQKLFFKILEKIYKRDS